MTDSIQECTSLISNYIDLIPWNSASISFIPPKSNHRWHDSSDIFNRVELRLPAFAPPGFSYPLFYREYSYLAKRIRHYRNWPISLSRFRAPYPGFKIDCSESMPKPRGKISRGQPEQILLSYMWLRFHFPLRFFRRVKTLPEKSYWRCEEP